MATWTCPFCNQNATLTGSNITTGTTTFTDNNKYGTQIVRIETNTCPNADCKEFTLSVSLHDPGLAYGSHLATPKRSWQLIPSSKAKAFPSYIPKAVLDDYTEACII